MRDSMLQEVLVEVEVVSLPPWRIQPQGDVAI
jgi:hypothetical protein